MDQIDLLLARYEANKFYAFGPYDGQLLAAEVKRLRAEIVKQKKGGAKK